jgi:transcriptional regulator of heat shock response
VESYSKPLHLKNLEGRFSSETRVDMPPGPAGGREREILTAIVETFIASGEPVGSRTLARASREGLSAATIRNVMADLADAGFLEQPHASAGRVPTAEAYRYYVEQLSGEAHLSHENQSIIQDTLTGVTDVAGVHGAHFACALPDFA